VNTSGSGGLWALAVRVPVTEVPLAAGDQLPGDLGVVPALGGDLLVRVLQVEVGGVAVLVHGVHGHGLLAESGHGDAVPGRQVLPAVVVVSLPVPVAAPVFNLDHDALVGCVGGARVGPASRAYFKAQSTVLGAPRVKWVHVIHHRCVARRSVPCLGPEIGWIRV